MFYSVINRGRLCGVVLFCVMLCSSLFAIGAEPHGVTLLWNEVSEQNVWGLQGASYAEEGGLPIYAVPLPRAMRVDVKVVEMERSSHEEQQLLRDMDLPLSEAPRYESLILSERGNKRGYLNLFPFVQKDGYAYKIRAIECVPLDDVPSVAKAAAGGKSATVSVLDQGRFVKIGVTETGIYKLSYEDLVSMGFRNPAHVRVYGYGGTMLNEDFSLSYHDDVPEVSLYVHDGGDGVFGPGDYVLFYGEGLDKWQYDSRQRIFKHTRNVYSTVGCYFVTATDGAGKSLLPHSQVGDVSGTISSFTDYAVHERDLRNFINSGREFYGEEFLGQSSISFSHTFPNLLAQSATLRLDVAAKSPTNSFFSVSVNGSQIGLQSVSAMNNASSSEYAKTSTGTFAFTPSAGDGLQVSVAYNQSGATGWLNYYEINVKRALRKLNNTPLLFRVGDYEGFNQNHRYEIANSSATSQVWDVTDGTAVRLMNGTVSGGTLSFVASTDEVREYVCVDVVGDRFLKPTVIGEVANQNLHGLSQADMIIISSTLFLSEAERLADAHRAYDGMTVHVVDAEEVYNEFSSGRPDATAYRRFMKMFYDRATSEDDMPGYLLLFGDGTFDNRKILQTSANSALYQLLTYQSVNSVYETVSYTCDDYFGLLDDTEGANVLYDQVDIGVGRFPVSNLAQARAAVDKTIGYMENTLKGSWKNQVLFVADDGDRQQHARDADSVANMFQRLNPAMQVKKLYLDAFKQEVTAAGERYPLAKHMLDNYIKSGVLMLNYMGHGGWNGWANEQILTDNDIDNMYNQHLPLWVTATCDFAPFDGYKESGGERVFWNPNGGGVALFTTTRTVYIGPNFQINLEFCKHLTSEKRVGVPNRLGDAVMLSKNKVSAYGDPNRMSFTLLGDPALMLGNPRTHSVVLDSINGREFTELRSDTISALDVVRLSGSLWSKEEGIFDDSFNGVLHLTVFDKEEIYSTLDNDEPDEYNKQPYKYRDRGSVMFSGTAKVESGRFDITFMLPKDIKYNYGSGRLVFYASDSEQNYEGNGFVEDVIVGGESTHVTLEYEGPEIEAYLNTPSFKSGDKVNSTPLFVAHLRDVSGINTIGSGVGHDIVLKLNNDPSMEYVLNSYYESQEYLYKIFENYSLEGNNLFTIKVHNSLKRKRDSKNNP